MISSRFLVPVLVLIAACGEAPTTTLSPPPGDFEQFQQVIFTTDTPATVHVTVDGSDPRQEGGPRLSGPSPFSVTLDRTSIVSFYAEGAAAEPVRSVLYRKVPVAPVTTVAPAVGSFNGTLAVTLTADKPATVFATLDGADPRVEGPSRLSGPSPLVVTLEATTTVRYYAASGSVDEPVQSATWVRVGGASGTIAGTVRVAAPYAGRPLLLEHDDAVVTLQESAIAGDVPFLIEGAGTGRHRVRAVVDLDGNGAAGGADAGSEQLTVDLDLSEPMRASAEKLVLHLGVSERADRCAFGGVAQVAAAASGQSLGVSMIDPVAVLSSLAGGGSANAALALLQGGDQVALRTGVTDYPWSIADLEPRSLVPLASITSLTLAGLNLHLQSQAAATCAAGQSKALDWSFGGAALTGRLSVPLAAGPVAVLAARRTGGLSPGAILSKESLITSVQLAPATDTARLEADWRLGGLQPSTRYQLRVFTGQQTALTDALAWALPVAASADGVLATEETAASGERALAEPLVVP